MGWRRGWLLLAVAVLCAAALRLAPAALAYVSARVTVSGTAQYGGTSAPLFSCSASPASLTVTRGGAAGTINVTCTNNMGAGATGTASVTISPTPSGKEPTVTLPGSFSVSSPGGQGAVRVTAAKNDSAGTYSYTLGVSAATVPLNYSINIPITIIVN